jgi:hypothetical protein
MGFLKQQEERLAIRFLSWQYQKWGKPVPEESELKLQASKIVADAHHILWLTRTTLPGNVAKTSYRL